MNKMLSVQTVYVEANRLKRAVVKQLPIVHPHSRTDMEQLESVGVISGDVVERGFGDVILCQRTRTLTSPYLTEHEVVDTVLVPITSYPARFPENMSQKLQPASQLPRLVIF